MMRNCKHQLNFRLFLSLILIASVTASAFASEPTEYRFARAPQQSARATVEAWAPLLKRISADSGVTLKLMVYDSREKFEADFLDGVPDFTFGNLLYAVMGRKRHGYQPILRDDAHKLTGIIVVRADSGIRICPRSCWEGRRVPRAKRHGRVPIPARLIVE